jgi:hypothetical protein
MESKKKYRLAIGILLLALTVSTALAYTFYIERPVSMIARIRTTIDFNIFEADLVTPFTSYDWGDYGAGSNNITRYLKTLSNDKAVIFWNITTPGWTLIDDPTIGQYYTDGKFNVSIHRDHYLPNSQREYVWNPNYPVTYEPGWKSDIIFRCWTSEFLACSDSWSITFYGHEYVA